jgi:molybdopterin biosynthesis enzyme MoaB
MTPEQQKAVDEAVEKAIKTVVNGKIDGLRKDLQPLTDAFQSWNHLKAGFIMYGTAILALGGAVQAIQALWGLISPHIKP